MNIEIQVQVDPYLHKLRIVSILNMERNVSTQVLIFTNYTATWSPKRAQKISENISLGGGTNLKYVHTLKQMHTFFGIVSYYRIAQKFLV